MRLGLLLAFVTFITSTAQAQSLHLVQAEPRWQEKGIIDIAQNTLMLESDLKGKGSFVIDCDDGGDHLQSGPARMAGVAGPGWQFLKDHPYRVNPKPYASLPATFPSYCKIM